jgi:hypothetical protein
MFPEKNLDPKTFLREPRPSSFLANFNIDPMTQNKCHPQSSVSTLTQVMVSENISSEQGRIPLVRIKRKKIDQHYP